MPDETQASKAGKSLISSRLVAPASWLIATALAAYLGWLIPKYLEQPGPSVLVANIAVSTRYSSRFPETNSVSVPVKDPLFQNLAQNEWSSHTYQSTSGLDELTKYLTDEHDNFELLLRKLGTFRDALPTMRDELEQVSTDEIVHTFFDQWVNSGYVICGGIDGDVRRGTYVADSMPKYKEGPVAQLFIDYYFDDKAHKIAKVDKVGGLQSATCIPDWDSPNAVHELNEVIPAALAHFDRVILRRLLDDAAKELQNYDVDTKIRDDLDLYIKGYSRWALALLFTNAGGQPLSFGPEATLVVDTRDYKNFENYTQIHIESRAEGGDLVPVTLAAGESKLVTFVARNLIVEDEHWKSLLDIFNNRARKAFVIVHPESDVWNHNKTITSPVRMFGAAAIRNDVTTDQITHIFAGNSD